MNFHPLEVHSLAKISLQIKCRLLFMLTCNNASSAAEVDHICMFNSWADAIA